MAPLIVLIGTFALSLLLTRLVTGRSTYLFSGIVSMSVMLLFTSVGHFIYAQGMAMMIPGFIPFKVEVVYFTGLVEIAAAVGLLIPRLRPLTGWLLILFFVLVLPANIYAAINRIDYQTGLQQGHGAGYLWFRVPLQLVFIGWVYFFAIRHEAGTVSAARKAGSYTGEARHFSG